MLYEIFNIEQNISVDFIIKLITGFILAFFVALVLLIIFFEIVNIIIFLFKKTKDKKLTYQPMKWIKETYLYNIYIKLIK